MFVVKTAVRVNRRTSGNILGRFFTLATGVVAWMPFRRLSVIRTQVQSWLRLAGHEPVPAIYGPSGDVKWDEADPTYSVEAAKRGE